MRKDGWSEKKGKIVRLLAAFVSPLITTTLLGIREFYKTTVRYILTILFFVICLSIALFIGYDSHTKPHTQ